VDGLSKRDIDDAFRCDDISFHEGLMAWIISRRKRIPPSLSQKSDRRKVFASGSARMGNTQCSMALYQANWTASIQYQ
jgi:hypothetical protein